MTALIANRTRAAALVGMTTVTGTTYDSSGYPLSGVEVRLYDGGVADGSLVEVTTTDDAGCYRFVKVLTDGTDRYRLEADDLTGNHVYACSDAFVTEAGVPTVHDLTMQDAGIIRGKVTSPHAVLVTADSTATAGEVTVSANGTFRLGGLPAGTYIVNFVDLVESQCKGQTTVKVVAAETTTLKARTLSTVA